MWRHPLYQILRSLPIVSPTALCRQAIPAAVWTSGPVGLERATCENSCRLGGNRAVIRFVVQLRSLSAVLLLMLLGIAAILPAAQADPAPPKELVQYVHDARRRGISEAKIKKQAVTVGWSAAVVDAAIAYDKSGKPLPEGPAAPSVVATSSELMPPGSNALHPRGEPGTPPLARPDTAAAPTGGPRPSIAPASAPEPTSASGGAPTARTASADYLIGAGDTLQISVWKEVEVSVPSVVVRPDGKITMPLIKEVEVAGLSPRQAEAVITEGLGKFITDPNVTVVVASAPSKKIYLVGAVKKEAPIPYTYGMTVLQALSEAGGLTDYAKRKKIYILRTENGREYRLDFNYEEVVRGQNMGQNFLLLPGDTVVVPQ